MRLQRTILILAAFCVHAVVLAALSSLLWLVLVDPRQGWREWVTALDEFPYYDEPHWLLLAILPGGLIAATQFLFLAPIFRLGVKVRADGRPLLLSLVGGAFVAALMCTALVLVLIDLAWLAVSGEAHEHEDYGTLAALVISILAASWLIWTPLLVVFCRRRPKRSTPERLVAILLGGTIAEMFVIVPVDLLIRHRDQCFCATASFHATWLGALALLWLTGPGILLALTSKRRRAWRDTHCMSCGYRKGPGAGERCPECGYEWG